MKQSNAGTIIGIETCEFLIQGFKWILVLESVKKKSAKNRSPRENNHSNSFKRYKTHDKFRKA